VLVWGVIKAAVSGDDRFAVADGDVLA